MINKSLQHSKILAFIGGTIIPILETIRRRDQLLHPEFFFNWFDDYLLGGFLLFAAWKVHKDELTGQRYLAAAWGVGVGALFLSTIGQFNSPTDPSHLPSLTVALIKTSFLLIAISALVMSLKKLN